MFIFENIGRNINNVSIQCFTNVIWRRDDGNSLSWSLVARSRVADRHTPREKTLWNHFNKHMEKHNNYFLLMFLKKHWEKMVHVFTMFFSWDWRSQDGFPTVRDNLDPNRCPHQSLNPGCLNAESMTSSTKVFGRIVWIQIKTYCETLRLQHGLSV